MPGRRRGFACLTVTTGALLFAGIACFVTTDEQLWQRAAGDGGLGADGATIDRDGYLARLACSDGVDNDGDGRTDYPADPGCDSADDGDEHGTAICDNGLDDDGDQRADYAIAGGDPGCSAPEDDDERGDTGCDDGLDNDGDGLTDYPADPGCSAAADDSELGPVACDNGVDDDGDGTIDFRDVGGDPGCTAPGDTSELGALACDNGIDDDGDTKVDFAADGTGDPQCSAPSDQSEGGLPSCSDGVDNDGDGRTDFRSDGSGDPGCSGAEDGTETGDVACDDGRDNDGDGRLDFRSDGSGDPGCSSPDDGDERGAAACDNGVDDDGDGRADYHVDDRQRDPGCSDPSDNSERGVLACDNGLDDDGDGRTDFRGDGSGDPGCAGPIDTTETALTLACDNGLDDDEDGRTDFRSDGSGDPDCSAPEDNDEGGGVACADGRDNDGDGRVDYPGDPGCSSAEDPDERGTAVCDDGLDNDEDGKIDYPADPECSGPTGTREGCSWRTVGSPTTQRLNGLWLTPAGDLWAVGDKGVAIRLANGAADWQVVSGVPASRDLYDVWSTDVNVWIVGERGTQLLWREAQGWDEDSPGGGSLYGVAGVPTSYLWLVGAGGVVQRYDVGGGSHQTFESPSEADLQATWGSGERFWAVGRDSALIRFDENAGKWVADSPGAVGDLYDVHGRAASDIWAVGVRNPDGERQPLSLHNAGSGWTSVPVPGGGGFYGVWVTDAGRAFAVGFADASGTQGTVQRYSGAEWVLMELPAGTGALRAIWAGGECDAWAVGDGGVILRYAP